ncbi:MAG: BCCT family transporter, partial [Nereida ignava]
TILGVAVTIGFGVSQFIDGLYAISGLEFLMDSSGDAPTPSKVGLLAGLLVIMSLSILSAVSGVGKGVKYLSNLNLVLSVILLSVFILFGSFAFAMSTYVSAFLDYIINLASLSFGAYSPLSDANFTSALPEVAQPLAADLFAGATNAWGSLDGFKAGLSATAEATTAAAAISGEPLSAVYSAADVIRDGGDIDMDAFVALLPEAAAPMAAELSELAAKSGSPEALQATVAGLAESRTAAAALDDATLAAAYEAGNQGRQFGWQSGWTTFYWAWWIAFSPFVGLFLARISRGRSVREFIIGCVIAPSLVCFAWMTILGGTAIDLELSGAAEGAIIGASNTAKLFVTLEQMIQGPLFTALSVMCVVLIMTFLVTSADSGILVMNTIMSGGDQEAGVKHRIVWGVVLTLVIASLLLAGGGGLDALKNAMIIGALPFTAVMGLMMVSLAKAMWRDHLRAKESGQ